MTCQTSLRNVDQGIRLLLDREDGTAGTVPEPPFEPVTGSRRGGAAAGGRWFRWLARSLRVGELRPNQLLHTYGVGAVADLPNLSVVVAGLDDWELGNSTIVDGAAAAVRGAGPARPAGGDAAHAAVQAGDPRPVR